MRLLTIVLAAGVLAGLVLLQFASSVFSTPAAQPGAWMRAVPLAIARALEARAAGLPLPAALRILLARRAPLPEDLRAVVAALRALGHLKRMGNLARHIADIARLKHPNPMIAGEVRPVLARMSLLASQFAEDAAIAIEHQDRVSGNRLAEADHEVDALRRHLFAILFADSWAHGVEQAVDAALIGRYYERFADHAVAVAAEARYLRTRRTPEPHGLEAGGRLR